MAITRLNAPPIVDTFTQHVSIAAQSWQYINLGTLTAHPGYVPLGLMVHMDVTSQVKMRTAGLLSSGVSLFTRMWNDWTQVNEGTVTSKVLWIPQ